MTLPEVVSWEASNVPEASALNTQRPECVRNAPSEVLAGVPSPGKRAGGRSVSYPRSDLNRHWGPF